LVVVVVMNAAAAVKMKGLGLLMTGGRRFSEGKVLHESVSMTVSEQSS
jgi:hypothetical protein